MIFISFFTPNGRYPTLAAKLHRSLNRFDLAADIAQVPPFASWAEGCRFKSRFILSKLIQHRQPVVWMDVDTEVWQRPTLLFGPEDFAIYNWCADRDHHLDGRIPHDPASQQLICSGGVQKWGYTAPALELLLRWISRFDSVSWSGGDDPLLDVAFNGARPPVTPLWLPKTYNRMDKLSPHWARVPSELVVINHDYTGGRHRESNAPAPNA